MNTLEPYEMEVLQYLLGKLERLELIKELLFDTLLAKYGFNRSDTAEALGVSVSTVTKWIKELPHKH
jgi:transcriptional regulator with PAS, ATPase and Fis domain